VSISLQYQVLAIKINHFEILFIILIIIYNLYTQFKQ